MIITTVLVIIGLMAATLAFAFVFVMGYSMGVEDGKSGDWIRIEEGPPDSDEYDFVLAYVHINDKLDNFTVIAEYVNGEWRRDVDYAKLSDLGMTVTHWLPLPVPPHKENDILFLEV